MLKAQTKQIGGRQVTVSPMNAWDTYLLEPEIAPLVMDVAPVILAARVDGGVDVDAALREAVPALGRICARLPREKLKALTEQLLFASLVDGRPLLENFNALFSGRTLELWQILYFALEVNYPDFFTRLRGFDAGRKAPDASEAPST